MTTWSTLNYLLIIQPFENEQMIPYVKIQIFQKYYATTKLLKKLIIKGFSEELKLFIMSFEDYEVEKLLKNIENGNIGVNYVLH